MDSAVTTHTTVLLEETVQAVLSAPRHTLRGKQPALYVDTTFGRGGHTRMLLQETPQEDQVIAWDQDASAIEHGAQLQAEFPNRLILIRGNFRYLSQELCLRGVERVDGVISDLGVSSPQFDEGERGFSYQQEARLDMRMDQSSGQSAEDLVNRLSERELTKIFREYGEENWSARVAKFIVERRSDTPIATTHDLVEIIKAAIPASARREGPHPARRIFQALRIAVNDELTALEEFLQQLPNVLYVGARVAVITFHSLEDRIVKRAFADMARPCVCPPQMPICTCGKVATMEVVTRKPLVPTASEIDKNPRARSAKLRVAERI